METFKSIALCVICAVGLTVGIAFVLPRTWEVTREIQIQAFPADIHHVVVDLETWKDWSPWGLMADNAANTEVGAHSKGVGATLAWSGPEVGAGSLRVLSEDRRSGLKFDLALRGGKEQVKGSIDYEEVRRGECRVTLTLNGDVQSNVIGRYIAFGRKYGLGGDLASALARLKKRVE